jgi:macrolide transport system ATP-binding/permease protein
MAPYRRTLARFLNLLFRRRAERELVREISAHLALLQEDYERGGMSPEQARLAARREFGGVEQTKEWHREERSFPWFEQGLQDLRYGFRGLVRNPGFTTVATLALALGIGVNTTLFSVYDAVALKPLPVRDPDRVVRIERWFSSGMRGDMQYGFSNPEYVYVRNRSSAFESIVAASWPMSVRIENREEASRASLVFVSADYFSALGVAPRLGRGFASGEDPETVVLSYPYWQRRFHGETQAIGSCMTIRHAVFRIIGVAPAEFTGTSTMPLVPDLWAPLTAVREVLPDRDWLRAEDQRKLQLLARLKSSVDPGYAQAQADTLIRNFAAALRTADPTIAVTLTPTSLFGNSDDPQFRLLVAALLAVTGLVLLVACANVANMLLARGGARRKEIALRMGLGAGRGRVLRQLLTESGLLASLGGAGGLLFSVWGSKLLWVSIEQILAGFFGGVPAFTIDLRPDARVLAYTFAVSLATAFAFGLPPALRSSRFDLAGDLSGARSLEASPIRRSRLRRALIAIQTAVSMTLLISTGLLLRGLLRSDMASPGFASRRVLLVSIELGDDAAQRAARERRLIGRIEALPEVSGATLGSAPMSGTWTPPIVIEGPNPLRAESTGRTVASYASDTYFRTLGIALLTGRDFTPEEAASSARVAVISESTARNFWPGENPLGRRFKLDRRFRGHYTEYEVIGIAADARFANLTRIDPAHVYLPTAASHVYPLLVRAAASPREATEAIRKAVAGSDEDLLPSLSLQTLEGGPVRVQRALARYCAIYAAVLAFWALILAGVGIYGVLAYLVSQRVPEIGVRCALGATPFHILREILSDGLRPALFGLAAGTLAAFGVCWALRLTLALPGSSDFFYGVPFYDPVTLAIVAAVALLVAGTAAAGPAWRALRLDPMDALRRE